MQDYEFIATSDVLGDCTCYYEIKFNRIMTLKDFVESIFKKNEWGYIDVNNFRIEYKKNKIIYGTFPPEYYLKTIKSCTTNGGWSRMDYRIVLND